MFALDLLDLSYSICYTQLLARRVISRKHTSSHPYLLTQLYHLKKETKRITRSHSFRCRFYGLLPSHSNASENVLSVCLLQGTVHYSVRARAPRGPPSPSVYATLCAERIISACCQPCFSSNERVSKALSRLHRKPEKLVRNN